MLRATSGQFLYFGLVSAISGNPVTGASGAISGRKCTDAISGMIVLSGNIIELGGGMYRANLYDFDTSGLYLGYLFTASGCVQREFSIVTVDACSGRYFLSSGQSTATNSGQSVLVYSGQLSGQFVNVHSGTLYLASGCLSGQLIGAHSGQVRPGSGTTFIASGPFVNVPVATLSGVIANSGLFVTVPVATISGIFPASGSLSGQRVDILSGNVLALASGTVLVQSGTVYLASGHGFFISGQLFLASGALSGQIVTPQSGVTFIASGPFVNVPVSTLSGIQPISGTFVTVPVSTLSGVVANSGLFVTVPIATISGIFPASGSLSGQQVNLLSGNQVQVWSGTRVNTFSGQNYFASGIVLQEALDVDGTIESGLSMRQAMRLSVASIAGPLSGAGTTTVTIGNAASGGAYKNRIVAVVNSSGNRVSLEYDVS